MMRAILLLIVTVALSLAGCGPSRSEIKKRQEDAKYHYNLAYGHFMAPSGNQTEAALREVFTSLELDEANADAHQLLGLILMGRNVYLEAATHFQRAIELRPNFYEAQNNLGATYLAMERWDDAIAVYDPLVSNMLYAWPAHGHNNLGWAWYKKGNLELARRHFMTAIELKPEFCLAYNNLGIVYIDEGLYDKALRYLERGIKRCAQYAEPYFHLGRIAEAQRDLATAVKHYENCRRLAGESTLADRCEARLKAISM